MVVAGDGVGFRVEEQADAEVQLPHRLGVREAPASCRARHGGGCEAARIGFATPAKRI